MIIYFLLLFVVAMAVYLAQKAGNKTISRFFHIIAFTSLVLVSALRSQYVGTDTGNYVHGFNWIHTFADVWNAHDDPGYYLLCWLGHFISDNYMAIFILMAFVVTICFFRTIREYSVDAEISFFVLLVSGIYFIHFNGARQGLACAIYFLAIGALLQNNIRFYIIAVAVAFFFHRTAVIALPAYFLITQKSRLKNTMLIVFLGAIAIIYFDQLVGLGSTIEKRYAVYSQADTARGYVTTLFICCLCAFFLIYRRHVVVHLPAYDILLKMFMLASAIVVIVTLRGANPSGIRRLSWYFSMSEILLWPIVFANIQNRLHRGFLMFPFISFYMLYYGLTLQAFSNLVPYTFNPVVESWFGF